MIRIKIVEVSYTFISVLLSLFCLCFLTIAIYREESSQQSQVLSLSLEASLRTSLEVTKQQQSALGEWKQNSSTGRNRTQAT